MNRSNQDLLLSQISEACQVNKSFGLVTVLDAGSTFKFLVYPEDPVSAAPSRELPATPPGVNPEQPITEAAAQPETPDRDWAVEATTIARQTIESLVPANLVDLSSAFGRSLTVAVEVIRPRSSILIFGAGHVGQALALMAALAGYAVTIVDDREHFLSRERLPDRKITLKPGSFEQIARETPIFSTTAIVIVTRGHQWDEVCLRAVANSPAGYIGMIGSKRRVIAVFERLVRSGVSAEVLDRVKAPIGLDIGARSPQEIAVAILAQIIETFNCPAAR